MKLALKWDLDHGGPFGPVPADLVAFIGDARSLNRADRELSRAMTVELVALTRW